jgi:hypothetical protein
MFIPPSRIHAAQSELHRLDPSQASDRAWRRHKRRLTGTISAAASIITINALLVINGVV